MGLAAQVLWLTTSGWGLPFTSLADGEGSHLKLCTPVNKNGHDIHIIKHERRKLKSLIYCKFNKICEVVLNLQK
jgi:hypothetical protein